VEKESEEKGGEGMTKTPGFVGQRLTEGRCARGISGVDFAAIVGVSAVSISKYENGHQTPRIEVLHAIASALKLPNSYFLRPMPTADERPVFWRGKLSAPSVMRERAAVRLEWLKEIVDYIAEYFELPTLNVPDIPIDNNEIVDDKFLEETAHEIRQQWSIRPGPMPDVVEKLETNGILVSRIHVNAEKLDAFSQWSERFGIPFVVLGRDKSSATRQRFDALHELSHLVLDKNTPQKRLNDPSSYKAIERRADRLASCLLLPADEFTQELYAPSLDGFLTLKERWGASIGAMIMRCHDLDIINDDESRRMWINYNRRGWRNREPLDGKMEKEVPHLIRRSFELLISEKVQSVPEILNALPFPPAEIEELADLEPGILGGEVESRAEPILKPEFRNGPSNVVQIFGKKDS
jgi:Zn-dependent peptidase ImmA (M78 family)/DNA-binding XRE family transcriptional regulator